jgi:hypothetical protein
MEETPCIQTVNFVLSKQSVFETVRYLIAWDFLCLHATVAGISAHLNGFVNHSLSEFLAVVGAKFAVIKIDDSDAEKLIFVSERNPIGCHLTSSLCHRLARARLAQAQLQKNTSRDRDSFEGTNVFPQNKHGRG